MFNNKSVAVVEVPSGVGVTFQGVSRGCDAIKSAGMAEKLESIGYSVSREQPLSGGPIECTLSSTAPNGARDEKLAVSINGAIRKTVQTSLASSAETPFQLLIGGPCSISPGVMSAFAHHFSSKRVGLLYIDADADLTAPTDPGSSGIICAMTFTHLTLRPGSLESMKTFSKPDGAGVVDSSNAIIYGMNVGFAPNRREHLGYLFDEGFRVITSKAVATDATGRAEQALKWLQERVDYIYVHLDVDAIDAGEFPLGNIPNYTGAGFKEILTAVNLFLTSPNVCGLHIAEINPDRDSGLVMTRRLVDEIVEGFRGRLSSLSTNAGSS